MGAAGGQPVLLFAAGLWVEAGLHTSATAAAIDSPGEVMAKKVFVYQPCRQRCTVLWQAEPLGTEAEPVLRIPTSVTTGPERLPGSSTLQGCRKRARERLLLETERDDSSLLATMPSPYAPHGDPPCQHLANRGGNHWLSSESSQAT